MHGRFEYLMPKLMHGHNLVCNLDQNGREEAQKPTLIFFLISKHKKYIYLKVYWIVNKSTLRSTLELNKIFFSHGLFLFVR